jgi:hypothetical protein
MKTYSEWARDNHVMHRDVGSLADYMHDELVAERNRIGNHRERIEELEAKVAEAFKQEDQRHRYLTNAGEKSRRRINQLERDRALTQSVIGHMIAEHTAMHDGGVMPYPVNDATVSEKLEQDQNMIMLHSEALLDIERRSLRGRWKTVRGWFT